MKALVAIFLISLLSGAVASKGLLLSEVTRLKNQLKDTIDVNTGKLKERKLSVINQHQASAAPKKSAHSPVRVDRYLKPTTPRYLADTAAPKAPVTKNTVKPTELKASTKTLAQKVQPRKLRRPRRRQSKNMAKKAKVAKKVTKKAKASKHVAKKASRFNVKKQKAKVAKKKVTKAKKVHHKKKAAHKKQKKAHLRAQARRLTGGLNDNDEQFLSQLSKKVQTLKAKADTNSTKGQNVSTSAAAVKSSIKASDKKPVKI